jgi:hypothetical protein
MLNTGSLFQSKMPIAYLTFGRILHFETQLDFAP